MESTDYNQNDRCFPADGSTIHTPAQEVDQPSQGMIFNNDEQRYLQGGCLEKNIYGFHFEIKEERKQNMFETAPKDSTTLKFKNASTEVHINEFNIVRYLGCGRYGSVDAVKIIRKYREIDLAVKRHSELCICMQLMNSTMKKFYETMHSYKTIVCSNFDLFIARLIHNVVTALEFLSEKNYFHRDIKPENILVNSQGIFKLSDYGICCKIDEIYSNDYRLMGTIHYLSPELLGTPPDLCSKQSELWALGISLIEIISGQHPCIGSDILDQWGKIQSFNPTISNKSLSKNIEALILSLVEKDVQYRPNSYSQILSMPFVQNIPKESTIDEINFIGSVIEIIQELSIEASEY
ncbi:unnamed protein product [Rotaria sp. Silwood1]|nr:unnamed protein product [Rotaria sp. Silwood1]CAF1532909.1 unnamed protein product [Rotaria sp. Silwood1]CAF4937957.1 unnamed protein product [Rotaria sp. Silwood1]